MDFYKIYLKTVPKFLFAHGYKSDRYNITIDIYPNLLEFCYVEQGDILVKTNYDETCIQQGSFFTMIHDKKYNCRCNDIQHHFSFGIISDYDYEVMSAENIVNLLKENNSDTIDYYIVPICVSSGYDNNDFEKIVKKIVSIWSSDNKIQRMNCITLLFELLSLLTEFSIEQSFIECELETDYSKTTNIYCKKATEYILNHINEKIYVSDIAKSLNISYGYLSKIIYDTLDMTLVDHINRLKLNRIKELIITKNVTLKEAGYYVGINDENYLSRIFKKYNGLTASEFKNIHNNAASKVINSIVTIEKPHK